MKRKPLWKFCVRTSSDGEEVLAEAMEGVSGQPASSYCDLRTGIVSVTVFLTSPSAARPLRERVRQSLQTMEQAGVAVAPARVSLRRVRDEDWAESWKRHFHPLEIGSRLLVKPSWSRKQPCRGQAVVVLDPGLSFGTGQHPTTAYCLQELAARSKSAKPLSLLDMGTGSGILAIAAVKLGFKPIEAFDFDPEAVRVARANARQNGVARAIRLDVADLTQLPFRPKRQFSMVCANLLSNLLIQERVRIVSRLSPGGVLVVAGILRSEFDQVVDAFQGLGLRLVRARSEKEWRSGTLEKRAKTR